MVHTLPKIVERSKKRLGRGHGSGKVKTSGRGQKGQKARGTVPPHFEGGQLSIMKRLPLLRGKGRNKSRHAKPAIITTSALSVFKDKATVSLETLKKEGVIPSNVASVKVLAGEAVKVSLTVSVPCSESAKTLIEKAGGTVA